MDGDAGIRLEEGASVKVVPYSMAELIGASDSIFEEGRMEKCACCGTKESDTMEALKRCSKCKSAFYCGKVYYFACVGMLCLSVLMFMPCSL
jgi:hypothetical protein